jgi:hypothetical protein
MAVAAVCLNVGHPGPVLGKRAGTKGDVTPESVDPKPE